MIYARIVKFNKYINTFVLNLFDDISNNNEIFVIYLCFKKKKCIDNLMQMLKICFICKHTPHVFGQKENIDKKKKKKSKLMNESVALTICILTIIILIAGQILGYIFISLFQRYRSSKWFQKRYDHLTVICSYLLQIYLVGLTLRVSAYWFPQNYSDKGTEDWWRRVLQFLSLSLDPTPMLIISAWAYRCWLGHYHMCYNYYMFENMWKAAIDPLHFGDNNVKNNFYVQHLSTLGHNQYMKTRVGVVAILSFLLLLVFNLWVWYSQNRPSWFFFILTLSYVSFLASFVFFFFFLKKKKKKKKKKGSKLNPKKKQLL
ncbi:hypothetical protein RFI_13094 [Reticulomyxa filosa]|uniref:Uncharacterized protein n=1 Tax=Reticulomyxa filosa TaxID=46433 RepID=X6NDI7_RETFI|nr:hypothetical protein RFI_13094 [Reticulomyxa filosa]|eukprot:ETO24066.1 hypothetical protein RFI_13094 [Reticulomyxa filosa]